MFSHLDQKQEDVFLLFCVRLQLQQLHFHILDFISVWFKLHSIHLHIPPFTLTAVTSSQTHVRVYIM